MEPELKCYEVRIVAEIEVVRVVMATDDLDAQDHCRDELLRRDEITRILKSSATEVTP